MSMVERSGHDRRRAINDLDYFSRRWVERRSHKERRKEATPTQIPQKNFNLTDVLIRATILVLTVVAFYLVWQIARQV